MACPNEGEMVATSPHKGDMVVATKVERPNTDMEGRLARTIEMAKVGVENPDMVADTYYYGGQKFIKP